MKCIDAGIIRARKAGTNDDGSVFAPRMAEMREVAPFTIEPFSHGIKGVGKTGLANAYLNGPHGRAPFAYLAGALFSLSHRGQCRTDDRPTLTEITRVSVAWRTRPDKLPVPVVVRLVTLDDLRQ
jgi:hypothetical protein